MSVGSSFLIRPQSAEKVIPGGNAFGLCVRCRLETGTFRVAEVRPCVSCGSGTGRKHSVWEGGIFRVRRRRGSVLIISLIVMLVLMIVGGAIFTFAYANFRSAEQQRGIMRARTAADSLLYSVGAVISDDFATAGSPKMPISIGSPLSAGFQDGPLSVDMRISTSNGDIFILECSAQYGKWRSGKRSLEIIKKNLASGVSSEWIWR